MKDDFSEEETRIQKSFSQKSWNEIKSNDYRTSA